jgi:hypothetical protein
LRGAAAVPVATEIELENDGDEDDAGDTEMISSRLVMENLLRREKRPGDASYAMPSQVMVLLLRMCSFVLFNYEKKTLLSMRNYITKHAGFKKMNAVTIELGHAQQTKAPRTDRLLLLRKKQENVQNSPIAP